MKRLKEDPRDHTWQEIWDRVDLDPWVEVWDACSQTGYTQVWDQVCDHVLSEIQEKEL